MRQKENLKTGVIRKQSTPNFPENKHFLPPDTQTYVCVSGGKKKSRFFENLAFFLVTLVLKFALLPYYRRINAEKILDTCLNLRTL